MNQNDLNRIFDALDVLLKPSKSMRANHFMLIRIEPNQYVTFEHKETGVRVVLDYARKSLVARNEGGKLKKIAVLLTIMLTGCDSIPRNAQNDAILMNYANGIQSQPIQYQQREQNCQVVPIYVYGQPARYIVRCR